MKAFIKFVLFGLLLSTIYASENGAYYQCNAAKTTSDDLCFFEATPAGTTVWGGPAVEDTVNNKVGADFMRTAADTSGKALTLSPKPWTNGDKEIASSTAIAEDNWAFTLIFELIGPLRNMVMYHPDTIKANSAEWTKWTWALTSCKIKTEKETVVEADKTIVS